MLQNCGEGYRRRQRAGQSKGQREKGKEQAAKSTEQKQALSALNPLPFVVYLDD
jgi:hypothetical protein